ncbi:tripartite tricarboxylate transporter substrate binding protein [Hydrogenophaga sp. 2FB]|uniref:Bug family tripartite tricarboxylate transporter substrate binding protein n=1 Tax=Hydrogenophaga sp. 2FB TaxID=2502187 RepID=UPI0010F480F6|nr:tripartite tricarboxylate transporter substrate binding protein [Hydrogenophaga sp. 2FB]
MRFKIAGMAVLAASLMGTAWAFPDRPVTLVVPFQAGGGVDAATRVLAAKLQTRWNQTVVVENRPGATGAIGTEHVVRSTPDGHTLLVHAAILVSTEITRPTVSYRTLRDLVPVSGLFTTPIVYVASAAAPAGDLKAVLAAARTGQSLDYGSHGDGTSTNYIGEHIKRVAQVEMVHVPFNGDNPILTALLGGHLKTGFLSGNNAKRAQDSGKARMLAVCSARRSPLLPAVPTFAEAGIDNCDRDAWVKVFAPARTPPAVVEKLSRDVVAVLAQPDVREQFTQTGSVPDGSTPEQALREVQREYVWWVQTLRAFAAPVK